MKKQPRLKRFLLIAVISAALGFAIPVLTKLWLHFCVRDRIYSDINAVPKARVAVVLGAHVTRQGNPAPVLRGRLDTAIELYKAGKVEKLLMSGDNRFHHYNEPGRMMEYAIKNGVPAEDVAADYAGRRTYDTVYRAKHIFGLNEFIVVSQGFHLDRSLFLCDKLGVKAWGLTAKHEVSARTRVREALACVGAVVDVYIRHPKLILGKKEKI